MQALSRFHVLSRVSVSALVLAFAVPAVADSLSGDDIRSEIVGRRIYLATPFGGEFPLNYYRSGTIDGNGEALGLGRFVRPTDRGKWWVSGDRLCQRFETWYQGAPKCFELTRIGPARVRWVEANGESGTARIGAPVR